MDKLSETGNTQVQSTNLINDLRSAIMGGTAGILDVPPLVARVIKTEVWRERFVAQTKKTSAFASLEEFIETAPPEGLGTTVVNLKRLCATNLATLDLLDRSLKCQSHGGDRRSEVFKRDNVTLENKTSRGNSVVYSLRRLRASRSDLHARVIAGELTINQAMIVAGWRQKTITIAVDVDKFCQAIRVNFTPLQIKRIVDELNKAT